MTGPHGAWLLWLWSSLAPMGAVLAPKPVQCTTVDMQADTADCDANMCRLRDHARMGCGDLVLYADAIDIHFNDQHQFAGAEATGHTLVIQQNVVATCRRARIAADRITGTVTGATLEVRAPGARPDAAGVPQGRNASVLHGDIERLSETHFIAKKGDFTACDCGPEADPSWRLGSTTVDIAVNDRALIWGPQLYINPFSLGLVPITPPLLPLSLPLRSRAAGLLPPLPRKYTGPWLAVDLPFFVPLGESFDITVFAGIRPDWRDPASPAGSMHFYGAPRLGMRLRYAPVEGTRGRLEVDVTRDGAQGMARLWLAAGGLTPATVDPAQKLLYERRRALVNRVVINAQHQSRLSERVDWLLDAHWRSDDLIPQDFALDVSERFATYIPSRTQLTWRTLRGTAVAGADWLLRLDNVALEQGMILPVYTNTDGTEAGTMHRGPMLSRQWLPVQLGAGFTADGALNIVRLGTWSQRPPAQSLLTPVSAVQNQAIAGLVAGLGWQRPVGPLRLLARAAFDGLLVAPNQARARLDAAIVTDATADMRLVRHFGAWQHMVSPTLQFRGLVAHPWAPAEPPDMLHALDEREVRRISHQLRIKLRQHLHHGPSGTLADLEVAQPLDAQTGAWLSPWATLQWTHPRYGAAAVRWSFDYRYLRDLPMRELAVSYNVAVSVLRLSAAYDRLAPDADRFVRGLYELAAPQAPIPAYQATAPWVHLVRAGVGVVLPRGFGAGYAALYQLPPPGGAASPCATATPGTTGDRNRASCFIQHAMNLDYISPCNCWGVRTSLTVVPLDPVNTTRFNITFAVADTVVSMEPTAY